MKPKSLLLVSSFLLLVMYQNCGQPFRASETLNSETPNSETPNSESCSSSYCQSENYYKNENSDGVFVGDVLCAFTPASLKYTGDPEGLCLLSIETVNTSLENSGIENIRFQMLTNIFLGDKDFERTGVYPNSVTPSFDTLAKNHSAAFGWMEPYIKGFGSDFNIMYAAPEEGSGGANLASGGDYPITALGPTFHADSHEFGHLAGARHYYHPDAAVSYAAGFPLNGCCTAENGPLPGPLRGGTHMGGNSVWLYSDPVREYLVQEKDIVDPDNAPKSVFIGDNLKSNVTRMWKENAQKISQLQNPKVPLLLKAPELNATCAYFYELPNYKNKLFEVCQGDSNVNIDPTLAGRVLSILIGRGMTLAIGNEAEFYGQYEFIYHSIYNLEHFTEIQGLDFPNGPRSAGVFPIGDFDAALAITGHHVSAWFGGWYKAENEMRLSCGPNIKIVGFEIYTGSFINGLKAICQDNSRSELAGYANGSLSTFQCNNGPVTGIEVASGAWIDAIRFKCSGTETSSWFGGSGPELKEKNCHLGYSLSDLDVQFGSNSPYVHKLNLHCRQ